MNALSTLAPRARFRGVCHLSTRPWIYFSLLRVTGRLNDQCVHRDTAIVIEGFPRSANSTTVAKFLSRQPSPVRVAHHRHHAAQVLRAIDWGVPAVVLIRPPRAAALSLLALGTEARQRAGRQGGQPLAFSDVFLAYVMFYEALEPHLDYCVIGRFEKVQDDIGSLIQRVNARFGADFSAEEGNSGHGHELGWHAMPNAVRDGIKADLETRFNEAIATSHNLRRLVARAEAVHSRYVDADERAG